MKTRQKVFLTGGTAGIGRTTALLLAEKGYNVFIIGRNADKLKDMQEDAKARGVEEHINYLLQDLADEQALEKVLPTIWADHGPFDILINNAGLGFGGICGADFSSISYLIKTNLNAYLLLAGFF